MTDHTPPTAQQLDDIAARVTAATPGPWQGKAELASHIVCTAPKDGTYSVLWNAEWATEADAEFTAHAREDVPALLTEVRHLRAQPSAIEQVEKAFAAELTDDRALILLDALIVLRSKLPCTCARSQGLHEKCCRRYVPGHELLSPVRRLAAARAELRPAAPAAVVGGESGNNQ